MITLLSGSKSITVSQPESKDQLTPTESTKDTTRDKASSVTDKNIIDSKHEPSQNKLTSLRSENDSNTLVEKVKNKGLNLKLNLLGISALKSLLP